MMTTSLNSYEGFRSTVSGPSREGRGFETHAEGSERANVKGAEQGGLSGRGLKIVLPQDGAYRGTSRTRV